MFNYNEKVKMSLLRKEGKRGKRRKEGLQSVTRSFGKKLKTTRARTLGFIHANMLGELYY